MKWWRRHKEEELEAEIRSHLDMAMRDRMERGETAEQAHASVRREFGNVGLVKEVTREMWGWASLERLRQDLRFGLRMLRKNPGFSLIAILTLALGIGANTAIFSLLDKLLIRSLPVEQPQQLVSFAQNASGAPGIFSYPMYVELRDRNKVLSGLVAYFQEPFSLNYGSQTERVTGQLVSGNYFAVLGVRPALGRFFLPEEDRTLGTHPVAVISHGLWQQRFGADPAMLGKIVNLNGYSYTVVGVAPAEFMGTTRGTVNDVYVPMMMQAQVEPGSNSVLNNRNWGWLSLLGRLKPKISREQAQAALSLLADEPREAVPGAKGKLVVSIFLMDGSRGQMDRVGDLSLPLQLLMGVAGFVLLIACANTANLLLARASARRKEIAIRLSIGASRWRIVRQLLTESTMLAAFGGAAGLAVAYWFTGLLLGFQQQSQFVPRTFDGSLDGRALVFTLSLSLLTGIVFGLAPALQTSTPDYVAALKGGMPGVSGSGQHWRLHNLLVVVQVALSLMVLIGAGLCAKSLRTLQAIDLGFEPTKVVTASFDLSLSGYNEARGPQFISQLSERIAALPGVEAVSFAHIVAFSQSFWMNTATIEGYQPQPNEKLVFEFNAVSPRYFQTIGTPLLRGREFSAQDTADAPRVVIVNEAMARRYWPGQEAVGKRIQRGQFAEVIGVVKNTRERGLMADSRPTIYLPLLQSYKPEVTLHLRTVVETQTMFAAIRQAARTLDATLPVYNLSTLAQQKEGSLYTERLAATLLTLFGLLALLLATIGLYGVLSYAVTERTREMGIRMALGAQPRDLLKLVLAQGMLLTLVGLAMGVVAAFGLTGLLKKLLFGVSATDPLTFAIIPLLLAGVALLACWLPARRAMRVNPLEALRFE